MEPQLTRSLLIEREEHTAAILITAGIGVACLGNPGLIPGALLAAMLWRTGTPAHLRWLLAALGAAVLYHFSVAGVVLPGWTFRHGGWGHLQPLSVLAETIGGPAVIQALTSAHWLRQRSLIGHMRRDEVATLADMSLSRRPVLLTDPAHPPGKIRLGAIVSSGKPFDIDPAELATHAFIPGATGMGKTTTIARLIDGVLRLGYGVIIVDCKASKDFRDLGRTMAEQFRIPYTVVDPNVPESTGYNPCDGSAEDVSNKLLGAFSYEGAEVYKLAVGQAIPPVIRALDHLGQKVDLDRLAASFAPGMLGRLGRDAGEPHESILAGLEATRKGGGLGERAYVGLQYRLGMLMQGKFATIFRRTPALDWDTVLGTPSVLYFGLPVTAAGEDVELCARLIAQDLKSACARRLERGGTSVPFLVIFDEFAALKAAASENLVDLLLQARQAMMQLVIATQFLPEDVAIRAACLSVGLLICHRIGAGQSDTEELASAFGTRQKWESTLQLDRATGFSEKGSMRRVDAYIQHPNVLRALPVGRVAIRSVSTHRVAVVQIAR